MPFLTPPVIGGDITPQGDYPAVGALIIDAQLSCTGTLIRPDVVLTAAHCVDPDLIGTNIPGFTLQNDVINTPPTATLGLRAVKHPLFDINAVKNGGLEQFYDVGLLFLAAPIDTTDPMVMATPTDAAGFTANMDVQIVGYGRTSDATFDYGVKYNAIASLVSWNDTELQIGSGNGTPQNCNGDSGGPAIVDFGAGPVIIGTVSRSFTLDGDCAHGGVDTRVDAYRTWIDSELEASPPAPDAGVPAPDAGDDAAEMGDTGGCCSTSRDSASGSLLLAGALAMVLGRRKRAC